MRMRQALALSLLPIVCLRALNLGSDCSGARHKGNNVTNNRHIFATTDDVDYRRHCADNSHCKTEQKA